MADEIAEPAGPSGPSSGTPMVRMTGVNKHFGELHVLRDIDLEVTHGEVVVVLGPSGSGKSTLCRAINRLEPIDGGTVEIDGVALPEEGRELAKLRADVGMVFQQFNLFAHLTILDNVTLAPTRVRGVTKSAAQERARALLDRVGIGDQSDKYPAQLSGGQQQRVAIARSLAMEPKVMLFDEPTSALDPEWVGEVLALLRRVAAERQTMLIVTHEMQFAREVADRILFMDEGRIVEQGPPAAIFETPRDPRLQAFLRRVG